MTIKRNTSQSEQMREKGYVTFKSVLTPEEIDKLRKAVSNYFEKEGRYLDFGKTQPDAFAKLPDIRWVLCHEGILDAVRKAIGSDDLRYTYHSDIHKNVLGNWHTDTQAYFTAEEVLTDQFRVFKVGIYLQDHSENTQGLTVCEGSQDTGVIDSVHVKPVPTSAGDIIVFDVRILHHGDMKNFAEKVIGKVVRSNGVKYRINSWTRAMLGRTDKLSLFFTFGVNNGTTREFAVRNMARQNKQNGVSSGVESDLELAELLKKSSVTPVSV